MNKFGSVLEKICAKYEDHFDNSEEICLESLSVVQSGDFIENIPDDHFKMGMTQKVSDMDNTSVRESKLITKEFLEDTISFSEELEEEESSLPQSQRSSVFENAPVLPSNLSDAIAHFERTATESFAGLKPHWPSDGGLTLATPSAPPPPTPPTPPPPPQPTLRKRMVTMTPPMDVHMRQVRKASMKGTRRPSLPGSIIRFDGSIRDSSRRTPLASMSNRNLSLNMPDAWSEVTDNIESITDILERTDRKETTMPSMSGRLWFPHGRSQNMD